MIKLIDLVKMCKNLQPDISMVRCYIPPEAEYPVAAIDNSLDWFLKKFPDLCIHSFELSQFIDRETYQWVYDLEIWVNLEVWHE